MSAPAGFVEACNADDHGCSGGWDDYIDEPGPCAACRKAEADAMADALRSYRAASPAERDPAGYAADMRDAGRGHLLREEAESRAEMVDDARDRARDEAALLALAGHR